MSRFLKTWLKIAIDGLAAALAFWLAFNLRYEFQIPPETAPQLLFTLPHAAGAILLVWFFNQHKTLWRYTGLKEVSKLALVVILNATATGILVFMLTRLEGFPRSVPVILLLIQGALFVGSRLGARLGYQLLQKQKSAPKESILLVGAGDVAESFLRSAPTHNAYHIHGILDDAPEKWGRTLHGTKILGSPAALPQVVKTLAQAGHKISLIILTQPAPLAEGFVQFARRQNITLRQLGSLNPNAENLAKLKPVLIEDLLGRPARSLDPAPVKNMVAGKNVLVTGAGGSIGSELCRQILQLNPTQLTLVENNEFSLFQIEQELLPLTNSTTLVPVLADVRNKAEITALLADIKPDVLYHAAAYKHVPLVEANPIAGLTTNLFGTMNVADAAVEAKTPRVVVISSDKAVNPTNVMGATKRAAEIYCQNHPTAQGKTQFTTVRFGNVLGSSGSVIPHFTRQIESGGPVTITHKDAERYFMTIPEAVQLVMHAGALKNKEGHTGHILMLNMGEPVKIWHLAEEMVRLSGLTPHVDIQLKEIGLRPGEKMKEELWYHAETMHPTPLEDIFLVSPKKMAAADLQKKIEKIHKACVDRSPKNAVKALRGLVAEYTPADNSPYAQ